MQYSLVTFCSAFGVTFQPMFMMSYCVSTYNPCPSHSHAGPNTRSRHHSLPDTTCETSHSSNFPGAILPARWSGRGGLGELGCEVRREFRGVRTSRPYHYSTRLACSNSIDGGLTVVLDLGSSDVLAAARSEVHWSSSLYLDIETAQSPPHNYHTDHHIGT